MSWWPWGDDEEEHRLDADDVRALTATTARELTWTQIGWMDEDGLFGFLSPEAADAILSKPEGDTGELVKAEVVDRILGTSSRPRLEEGSATPLDDVIRDTLGGGVVDAAEGADAVVDAAGDVRDALSGSLWKLAGPVIALAVAVGYARRGGR